MAVMVVVMMVVVKKWCVLVLYSYVCGVEVWEGVSRCGQCGGSK